jgi:pimeloyl-ACP methyl ester carboxylesterase
MVRRSLLIGALVLAAALAFAAPWLRAIAPPPAASHYAFGSGPTIVLVHGLGSRITNWLPVARILARRHRVVLVELPGHGETPMPEPFTLDRAALSLDRAISEVTTGPVVLVGHSIGGLVAADEAIEHPSRVRALVLVEAPLRQDLDAHERTEMLASLDTNYGALIEQAYRSFGKDSAQGAQLLAQMSTFDSSLMRPWIRLAITTDLSPRGAEIRVPVLAVMAERSWPAGETWPAVRDEMGYGSIANLTPLKLEGCGHFVMLDKPTELAAAIARFADQVPAGAVAVK